MQRLQRKAGLLLTRTADDAQVGLLLKDFEDGDKALKNIVDQSKAFRTAWTETLQRASGAANDFETIYQFIHGDAENDSRYRDTDRATLQRIRALKETLARTREVIIQELGDVERRVAGPAKDARKQIEIYKKVIKKREDRKLDWERYKSRTEAMEKKSSRSDRDNNALMKHQIDLESSSKTYEQADMHLKETLPGLTQAVYALLPQLVFAQAMIQNTLFGHYYTAMHDFCQQHGYPIPSSGLEQIQSEFEDAFVPVKRETEALDILQKGKAVFSAYRTRPDTGQTTIPARNKIQPVRTNSSTLPPPIPLSSPGLSPPSLDTGSKPGRSGPGSSHSYSRPPPSPSVSSHYSSEYSTARPAASSRLSTPQVALGRITSASSVTSTGSNHSVATAASAIAAKKKKPPPPPPPKRKQSGLPQDYVIAQYDFAGQGHGDLPFREGDRIRVVKRTDSTNDWWEGECNGVQGSFPANYCK